MSISSVSLKKKLTEEKVKFKNVLYNSEIQQKHYNPNTSKLHTSYIDQIIEHVDNLYDLVEYLLTRQQQLELRLLPVEHADLSCSFVIRKGAYHELSANFTLGKQPLKGV